MRRRNRIFSIWRETALRYGFEEYDSSVLEQEEIYVAKSGPEILSQLFNFSDKGGRRVALRPEMTPTFARMIGAKGNALPKPLKWFSIAQCYRYERMSRGRKREHFQWNLDVVGVPEVSAEAELLALALDCLGQLGFTEQDVVVRVSHRGLLGSVLRGLEIPEEKWPEVFGIIDKRGKESDETIWKLLGEMELPEPSLRTLISMLDDRELEPFSRFVNQNGLDSQSVDELQRLFDYLAAYGLDGYCEFCPSIVRGLPYYTGTVFECFDREGQFRAIFGGGRYDNLLETLGGTKGPAVGLGFGDVVVQEIMEELGKLPLCSRRIDFVLIPYSEQERTIAIQIGQRLRKDGWFTDILLVNKKLKGALRDASRLQPKQVVLFLPEELEKGLLILRNMESGSEQRVPQELFLKEPGSFM